MSLILVGVIIRLLKSTIKSVNFEGISTSKSSRESRNSDDRLERLRDLKVNSLGEDLLSVRLDIMKTTFDLKIFLSLDFVILAKFFLKVRPRKSNFFYFNCYLLFGDFLNPFERDYPA